MPNTAFATLYRIERNADRQMLDRASTLRAGDGAPVDVKLDNISLTGCRISDSPVMAVGEAIMIGMPGLGRRAANVIWSNDGQTGCAFNKVLTQDELDHASVAITLVEGRFSDGAQIAFTVDDPAPMPRLRFRRRVAVIALCAALSWTLTFLVGNAIYLMI